MVEFLCRRCGLKLEFAADHAGQRVQCPSCGEQSTLPGAGEAVSRPASTRPSAPGQPPPAPHPARPMPPPLPRSAYPRRAVHRPVPRGTNAAAVVSLVLGLLSAAIALLVFLTGVTHLALLAGFDYTCLLLLGAAACAVIGGIAGVMGLQQARRVRRGKGLAVAGLILCLIPMVPAVIVFILTYVQCGVARLQ